MNLLDLYEMKDPRDAYERDVANSQAGMGKRSGADVTGEEEPSGVFTVMVNGRPWKTGSSNEMFALASRVADKHSDKKVAVKWPTGELNTVKSRDVDEGIVGNMVNKAKSMFTKPAAPAAPAPVVPNAATQARMAAAPQGYDPNTGKPLVAAKAAPGAVAKGGTMAMTKKVAPVAKPAAAKPAAAGKVQGIKSNVDVNTLQKFNGIVDVTPKIKPQIKDAGGVTWTKTTAGWTDGKRSIDPKDSTYQAFDDAWRLANGAQPGNVGVPGAQQPVAEDSQRVDSLVTDALKIMRGTDVSDAIRALKTVLGNREYNSRRIYYNFYVKQLVDMYGQQGMAETLGDLRPKLGSSRDQGKSVRKWRKDRGMDESGVSEAEVDSDGYSMDHADSGEYDYEGDQARDQINTIVRAARKLDGLLDDNENMPEWVQMKVTLAADYLDTAADYIESNQEPELDEGDRGRGRPPAGEQDTTPITPGRVEKTATGIRHHADASRYGGTEPDAEDDHLMSKSHISRLGKMTEPDLDEGDKIGNMDADKFDAAMARLKQLAGAGPLKTVWDPAKRVYRNVPVAVQPKK